MTREEEEGVEIIRKSIQLVASSFALIRTIVHVKM